MRPTAATGEAAENHQNHTAPEAAGTPNNITSRGFSAIGILVATITFLMPARAVVAKRRRVRRLFISGMFVYGWRRRSQMIALRPFFSCRMAVKVALRTIASYCHLMELPGAKVFFHLPGKGLISKKFFLFLERYIVNRLLIHLPLNTVVSGNVLQCWQNDMFVDLAHSFLFSL